MINNFLEKIGFREGQHVLVHSSFRKIKKNFGEISIQDFISKLKSSVTESGSLVMPTFTYCFRKKDGTHETFDRNNSASKVGALTENFRNSNGVVRTSSPTHSFALWGKATEFIDSTNNPKSPLGIGSPVDWFVHQPNSFVAMLGTDFHSFTVGHYLEITAQVPWNDISPWDHLGVEKIGVSVNGETRLKEVPGCSKSFANFENFLLNNKIVSRGKINQLDYYYIPLETILNPGLNFFKNNSNELLCHEGKCKACDERRFKLKKLGLTIK